MIDTKTGATVAEPFHMFVKPQLHPVLTDFCKGLTGITQVLVGNRSFMRQTNGFSITV